MSPRNFELGPLEMEILGSFEAQTGQSVHDIQASLKASGKALAYTTVMTVLTRLFEKGHLKREKSGRQFVYRRAANPQKVGETFLSKIRSSLFKRERLQPILSLLDSDEDLSKEELLELKRIVSAKLKSTRS